MTAEYIPDRKIFHAFVPHIMGTKLDFFVCGQPENICRSVWNGFVSVAESLDAILDRFKPESEVSRLNASVPFDGLQTSPELGRILKLSQEYFSKSKGMFDVTLGSGPDFSISVDNRLCMSSGSLDFGGFAKGYALSLCKGILEDAGVASAFVNFGNSSILAAGSHPFGDAWAVDVINPYNGAVLTTVRLSDRSMSTSGNTPGYSGHIVNPLTGERKTGRRLAVAVSGNPLDAEVLSTVAMVCDASGFAGSLPQTEYKIFEL